MASHPNEPEGYRRSRSDRWSPTEGTAHKLRAVQREAFPKLAVPKNHRFADRLAKKQNLCYMICIDPVGPDLLGLSLLGLGPVGLGS